MTNTTNELILVINTKFIHRNLLHFYTLTMKAPKEKFKTIPFASTPKKNKIPRNKLEALYSQQKQDQELTVVQIMNFLLPNSDLN